MNRAREQKKNITKMNKKKNKKIQAQENCLQAERTNIIIIALDNNNNYNIYDNFPRNERGGGTMVKMWMKE